MKIEDATKFFALPPQNKQFDTYLTSIGINERLVFDENPIERINKYDEGFSLTFDSKLGYEKWWGKAREEGEMIFSSLQVYSEHNDSGFSRYSGELPHGFTFASTLSQAISIMGTPTTDHPSGPENRVYVWYGYQGYTIGICFLPDDAGISFLSIGNVKIRPPKKLD